MSAVAWFYNVLLSLDKRSLVHITLCGKDACMNIFAPYTNANILTDSWAISLEDYL